MMAFAVAAIAFLLGLGVAMWLGREGFAWVLGATLAALALIYVWAAGQGEALRYAVLADLLVAPAFAGTALGGGYGLYRRRKVGQTARHDDDAS